MVGTAQELAQDWASAASWFWNITEFSCVGVSRGVSVG